MDVREERLQPVGDELHRPAQHHRQRRGRHLVRVDVHLDAEGAADVLRDHAHVALGDAEVAREDVLHHVRRLRRVVHRERMLGRVVVGEDRAPLEADAGVAAEVEGLLDHDVGLGEGLVDAAGVVLALEADVVGELRVDDRLPLRGIPPCRRRRAALPTPPRSARRASSACARDSATTAATASPCQQARSIAMACCGGDLMPFRCASTATQGVQYSATRRPVEHGDDAGRFACLFKL